MIFAFNQRSEWKEKKKVDSFEMNECLQGSMSTSRRETEQKKSEFLINACPTFFQPHPVL